MVMLSNIVVGETYVLSDSQEDVKIVAIHPDGKSCASLGVYNNWRIIVKEAAGWPLTEKVTKLDLNKTYTYFGKVVKNLQAEGDHLKGNVDGHGELAWWPSGQRYSHAPSECDLKEAKVREWTLADVPYPWPVVKTHEGKVHYAIQRADTRGLFLGGYDAIVTYRSLRLNYVWSQDGKTWNKFEVMETN